MTIAEAIYKALVEGRSTITEEDLRREELIMDAQRLGEKAVADARELEWQSFMDRAKARADAQQLEWQNTMDVHRIKQEIKMAQLQAESIELQWFVERRMRESSITD